MSESNIIDILLNAGERKMPEKKIKITKLSEELNKEIIFTIRALPYDEVENLKNLSENMALHIVLNGVVEPNLSSKCLMDKFEVDTPIDAIKKMLLPGEIEDIDIEIEKLSGYRSITVEDVKKK